MAYGNGILHKIGDDCTYKCKDAENESTKSIFPQSCKRHVRISYLKNFFQLTPPPLNKH